MRADLGVGAAGLVDLDAWRVIAGREEAIVRRASTRLVRRVRSPLRRQVVKMALRAVEGILVFGRPINCLRDTRWGVEVLREAGVDGLNRQISRVYDDLVEATRREAPAAAAAVSGAASALLAEHQHWLTEPTPEASPAPSVAAPLPPLALRGLASLPHVAFVLDRALRFVSVNPAWDAFARSNDGEGCLAERVVGTDWPSALAGPERVRWLAVARGILDGDLRSYARLLACHGPDLARFVDLTAAPLTLTDEPNAPIVGLVFISYDITELLRAQASQFWAEQRARMEARTAREFAFVAEAGGVLAASLEYEAAVRDLARLTVPALADLCLVHVLETDGSISRVATAHRDPEREARVRELQARYPLEAIVTHPILQVIHSLEPLLMPQVEPAALEPAALDAEHLAALQELELRSAIIVPLVARGRSLGAVTLLAAESGRQYGEAELALAERLARLAALEIDNARLYGEAQRAIRERDQFLWIASHELRTPVTTLLGFIQLAARQLRRRGELDPGLAERALTVVEEQARKLASLVDLLLDISRLESGHLALERRLTDLSALAEGVRAAMQARSEHHVLTLRAPGPVFAQVDPVRIEQVLTNLVDNAIKYSPADGPVEIEVATAAGTARVAVTDRGPGIPEEQRERIFNRFYRAHTEEHRTGLGLGLFISRQIVELHGGRLGVELPPEGGTRFVVYLPVGQEDEPGQEQNAS